MQIKALTARLDKVDRGQSPERASGSSICEECGMEYSLHPEHPMGPTFQILCSGWVVKL